MPVFYKLIAAYPTPSSLAEAQHEDIVEYFACLGLQNQRAKRVVEMAEAWCANEPERGKRYRKLGYPEKGDGRDVKKDEVLGDGADVDEDGDLDQRVAWEVAHLPGVGAYGMDSWRIFCRDELRGVKNEDFEPEWKRVLPLDKELRAYLRWMWLKEGFVWNPVTGKKRKAKVEELKQADAGGVIVEDDDGDRVEAADEN